MQRGDSGGTAALHPATAAPSQTDMRPLLRLFTLACPFANINLFKPLVRGGRHPHPVLPCLGRSHFCYEPPRLALSLPQYAITRYF